MKQYVGETESNWRFWKKCKNISAKHKSVSGNTFKAWSFPSAFNFTCKDGWVTHQHANTVYWLQAPLQVSIITNCCKELHLKCDRFTGSAFEKFTMHENKSRFMWNQPFLIVLKCCPLYPESLYFSVTLTVWWSIFGQPFSRWI